MIVKPQKIEFFIDKTHYIKNILYLYNRFVMSKSLPIDIKYPKKKYVLNTDTFDTLDIICEELEDDILKQTNIDSHLDSPIIKIKPLSPIKKSPSNPNLNFSICFDNKKKGTEQNIINFSNHEQQNASFKNILNYKHSEQENAHIKSLLSCTPPEKDFLLTKLNSIYPKSDGKWVNSSLVLSCQTCMSGFGLFNRKHHCRACGGVFCSKCCHKTIEIPKNFIQKPQEDDTYKQKISNMTNWFIKGKNSLVCNDCFNKITNLNQITWIIQICEFLDFKSLNRILPLSTSWHKAGIHQLSKFREIQYKYSELFTNWEQVIIWTSRKYFTGHNNWMIILIKSNLQYYYQTKKEEIIYELSTLIDTHKKNISCWNIMCSRKCNIEYDILDYIDILKYLTLLESSNQLIWTDKLLQEFLLLLLQNILDLEYKSNTVYFGSEFDNDLLDKIKSAIPLLCSIFVKLISFNQTVDYDFLEHIFNEFLKIDNCIINYYLETKYLDNFPCKDVAHIYFVNFMEELVKKCNILKITNEIDFMINFFVQLDKCNSLRPTELILNPLNLNEYITEIISVEKLKSNTMPLLVVAKVTSGVRKKIIKFIVKKDEGLRKESIVASIIKLLQDRLYKQAKKNRIKHFDRIPTYQIIMLTKNLAIVEYVENSLTLRMVSNNKFTLQNYILDNNPTEQVDSVKRKFLQSLAISSCLSYILGLGDRHLDNIMINNKGQIFHIDYGYLMDNPVTSIISNPNIKVTTVMIDFLGGIEGKYYKEFTQYIIQVYDILRLYKNLIVNYYEMLGEEKFIKWSIFKPKLEDRFLSGLSWKDIEVTLINEIENSNSYPSVFADLCHHYRQIITEYVGKKS